MNWISWLTGIYKLVPYVVAGVEMIHANENTQTKTQLAQDALSLALSASTQVLTGSNEKAAQIAAGAVSDAISSAQQLIAALK